MVLNFRSWRSIIAAESSTCSCLLSARLDSSGFAKACYTHAGITSPCETYSNQHWYENYWTQSQNHSEPVSNFGRQQQQSGSSMQKPAPKDFGPHIVTLILYVIVLKGRTDAAIGSLMCKYATFPISEFWGSSHPTMRSRVLFTCHRTYSMDATCFIYLEERWT